MISLTSRIKELEAGMCTKCKNFKSIDEDDDFWICGSCGGKRFKLLALTTLKKDLTLKKQELEDTLKTKKNELQKKYNKGTVTDQQSFWTFFANIETNLKAQISLLDEIIGADNE